MANRHHQIRPGVSPAYQAQQQYPVQRQHPVQHQVQQHYPVQVQQTTEYDEGCCSGRRVRYPSSIGIVLGSLLIVGGAISIIVNGVGIKYYSAFAKIGHGFWTGLMLIITGSLTIGAGKGKYSGLIIASMVISIVLAVALIPGCISLAVLGLASSVDGCRNREKYWDDDGGYTPYRDYCDLAVGVNGTLLGLAGASFFICIGVSILACVGLGKDRNRPDHVIAPQQIQMPVTTTTAQHPGTAVVQPIPYQNQGFSAPSEYASQYLEIYPPKSTKSEHFYEHLYDEI